MNRLNRPTTEATRLIARSRKGEGSSAVVLASVAISVWYGERLALRAAFRGPRGAGPVRPAWPAARLREFVAMLHRCFLGCAGRGQIEQIIQNSCSPRKSGTRICVRDVRVGSGLPVTASSLARMACGPATWCVLARAPLDEQANTGLAALLLFVVSGTITRVKAT